MGTCYWLKGRGAKALQYWQESMALAESIGARLELARTWTEVGRRLLEKGGHDRRLGGASAEEYLSKAEAFFREMDLSWDLADLERIRTG